MIPLRKANRWHCLLSGVVALMLVSAANYLPLPDPDGYLDRNILCRWMSSGEREVPVSDITEEESPCPRLLPAPQSYRNQNNCTAKCDPAAIAALIVERAEVTAAAMQERVRSLFASRLQS